MKHFCLCICIAENIFEWVWRRGRVFIYLHCSKQLKHLQWSCCVAIFYIFPFPVECSVVNDRTNKLPVKIDGQSMPTIIFPNTPMNHTESYTNTLFTLLSWASFTALAWLHINHSWWHLAGKDNGNGNISEPATGTVRVQVVRQVWKGNLEGRLDKVEHVTSQQMLVVASSKDPRDCWVFPIPHPNMALCCHLDSTCRNGAVV